MRHSTTVRKPISIWWRAVVWWNVRLHPVPVVAVTDKTITFLVGTAINDDEPPFQEVRRNLATDDTQFFLSFAEAKKWCIMQANNKMRHAESELNRASTLLSRAESLQEPK